MPSTASSASCSIELANSPPELSEVFASVFIKVGALLFVVLAGWLIYQHATQPELEVIGANEVRLQRHNDGHYHVDGSVHGVPVKFVVDTGASMVSVSENVARKAGLKCDQPATFTTANGKVEGCVATRQEIAFGGFRVFDVDVAIMPDMATSALLGMNVLDKFDLQQSGNTLVVAGKQVK
jgi:clan AA aspartic protease (TIGR02281 family)